MIVTVRLKPTGPPRWVAQARNCKRVRIKVRIRWDMYKRARIESFARKLGTAVLGVAMCAVTAADGNMNANRPFQPPAFTADPRIEKLRSFFEFYRCPEPRHIAQYLRVADAYGLDYRVLPAVSVRESTCGRYEKTAHNRWGWHDGAVRFDSVADGIEFMGHTLAEAPQYKGKAIDQLLWTYNPRDAYPGEIKNLMRKIEP